MRSEQGNFTPSTTQRVGLTWALAAVRNSFAAAVSSVPRHAVHAAPDEVRDRLQRDGLPLARRAADAVVDVDGQQADGSFDKRARSSAGLHCPPVLWVCAQERVSLLPCEARAGCRLHALSAALPKAAMPLRRTLCSSQERSADDGGCLVVSASFWQRPLRNLGAVALSETMAAGFVSTLSLPTAWRWGTGKQGVRFQAEESAPLANLALAPEL